MDFILDSRFENLENVDWFLRVVLHVRNGGWLVFDRVGGLFGFGMLNWVYWFGCGGFVGWVGASAAG